MFQWTKRQGRRKLTRGSSKTGGYAQVQIDGQAYYQHRLAFLFMTGNYPSVVDHINGDRSDNRWSNLREVTAATNYRNRGPNRNSTTGVKGVTFDKARDKYVAQLRVNRKLHRLGRYATVEEAADAYRIGVSKLVGSLQFRET